MPGNLSIQTWLALKDRCLMVNWLAALTSVFARAAANYKKLHTRRRLNPKSGAGAVRPLGDDGIWIGFNVWRILTKFLVKGEPD
jgi:hypothetical protein